MAVYVGNGKVVEALNESLGVVYRDAVSYTHLDVYKRQAIKKLEAEQNEQVKKKGRKAEPETVIADSAVKKQEEFEAMKKKTRNMLLGLVAVIVAAAAGIAVYKAMH